MNFKQIIALGILSTYIPLSITGCSLKENKYNNSNTSKNQYELSNEKIQDIKPTNFPLEVIVQEETKSQNDEDLELLKEQNIEIDNASNNKDIIENINQYSIDNTKTTKIKEYSIIAVGDIMLGSTYPSKDYLPQNDKNILENVVDELLDADITIGNLEGSMTNKGTTQLSGKYAYPMKMPESYVKHLVDCDFDFISLANNHINDFGSIGRNRTQELLTENSINFAGLIECETTILEQDGLKYGFCAFAPNYKTCDLLDIDSAKEIVSSLDKLCDITIVMFHGGAEGVQYQNVTKETEYYINQNRGNVHDFSHSMIDSGADLVFGSGPHVTRAIELYDNKFIAYSLGNFATYARFNISGVKGIAPIMKVYTNEKGEFLKAQIIPTTQIERGIPIVDKESTVIYKIQELTKNDFPKTNITIQDDGWVYKK
jgi:poly-gamma-glutamate capsule biosynthesis protein CapA/YwtB (metallophosphatase superfamily)